MTILVDSNTQNQAIVWPVIDAAESEEITVAVSADDLQAGDMKNPEPHPVAIALRRRDSGVDDARVSKREVHQAG